MQPYRNYATPSAAMRKGPAGPPIPGAQQQQQQPPPRPPQHEHFEAQARIRDTHESAKRRSQKPVDRNLPDGVDALVLGDAADKYNELREVEKQLDAVMMRKRLDIQDALQASQTRSGILRVWISNTVENQPWQEGGLDQSGFDFTSNVEATFRVKIEGRLLDDEDADKTADDNENDAEKDAEKDNEGDTAMDGDGEPAASRAKPASNKASRKRLSHFFKSITIDFDRPPALQPDNYARIQWSKPDGPQPPAPGADAAKDGGDFDRLEFQRKGDENVNVTINLVRDEQSPRYKLAPVLAELLDTEIADRKTVLMGIWEYVKMCGLQDENDSRRVNCDARLKRALGIDTFSFPHLVQYVQGLMFDAPPISLTYTIRTDKEFQSSGGWEPTVYDIPVVLEDPLEQAIKSSPSHAAAMQQIMRMDDGLAVIVQKMKHAKAKHGFFTSMSKDPANFTKRWVSSQKRDLDVILGAGPWGEEDWQSAAWRQGGGEGPWGTREAWEGVGAYLTRQDQLAKRSNMAT